MYIVDRMKVARSSLHVLLKFYKAGMGSRVYFTYRKVRLLTLPCVCAVLARAVLEGREITRRELCNCLTKINQ